jgi:hypothetical protein
VRVPPSQLTCREDYATVMQVLCQWQCRGPADHRDWHLGLWLPKLNADSIPHLCHHNDQANRGLTRLECTVTGTASVSNLKSESAMIMMTPSPSRILRTSSSESLALAVAAACSLSEAQALQLELNIQVQLEVRRSRRRFKFKLSATGSASGSGLGVHNSSLKVAFRVRRATAT